MKNKLKTLISLFIAFMKIGGFTFGGGYAMIPLIQRETVENKKWISEDDILDIVALAESTPGPIAINAATFVGYKVAGFFGAFFATLGVILPSFLIILAISFVLERFRELRAVQYAFQGIRAGVLALILKALIGMFKKCKKGVFSYVIMALAFGVCVFLNIPVPLLILLCAVLGLIFSVITKRRVGK